MKKRISCLLLSLLLVIPTMLMAGCNNGSTGIEEVEERLADTLSLVMVTKESTTDEAVSAVQDALNAIFESKYKTQVILTMYSEEEYMEKLDDRFDAVEKAMADADAAAESRKEAEKEAKKRGETLPKEETTAEVTADETILNDIGFTEIKYPELEENQIDIFFLSGVDNLNRYYDAERLAYLDEDLNSTSKKLTDYVYPTFIDAGRIGGSSVAVLNNHTIGEYTMLLINKELADKYSYDPASFTSLSAARGFIDEMAEKETAHTPFLEYVDCYDFKTWGEGDSVFGSDITDYTVYGKAVSARLCYTSTKFRNHYNLMRYFEEQGYFSNDPENDDTFAAAVVTGSLKDKIKYEEDYYVTVLQQPRAYNEDVYQGMFCVSGYLDEKEVSRAMEIITLINTDSTVRNILQYGVEGVHYKLNADGAVVRLNDDYMMDIVTTGNEFIAYPEEGMDLDVWEYGKLQNLDSTTYSLLGFNFNEDINDLFAKANSIYDSTMSILDNSTYAQLELPTSDSWQNPYEAAIETARFNSGREYSSITSSNSEENFAYQLNDWFVNNFG